MVQAITRFNMFWDRIGHGMGLLGWFGWSEASVIRALFPEDSGSNMVAFDFVVACFGALIYRLSPNRRRDGRQSHMACRR